MLVLTPAFYESWVSCCMRHVLSSHYRLQHITQKHNPAPFIPWLFCFLQKVAVIDHAAT